MARVTVEDAVTKMGNRFDLVLTAAKRARQLSTEGKEPRVEWDNDKATVVALREIEAGEITKEMVDAIEAAEEKVYHPAQLDEVAQLLSE